MPRVLSHLLCCLLSQRPIVVKSDAPVVLLVSSCQWPDWSHGNIHTAPRQDPEEEQVGGHLGQRSIQRALTSGSPKCSDGRIYYTYVTFPLPKQKLHSTKGLSFQSYTTFVHVYKQKSLQACTCLEMNYPILV